MKLEQSEFEKIRKKIYEYCGINLHEGKQALVRARVMKRIRKLGLSGFPQYLNYLERDNSGRECLALVDVLTTNKTSFFRESQHFDFIKNVVIPEMKGRNVKWWSAGCSTGEEPVSCAIALFEQKVSSRNVKILGTDLSRQVLQVAKKSIYSAKNMENISPSLKKKYFQKVDEGWYAVDDKIRQMITYGRLNLKTSWPLKGPFHVIMCRNVMIYFNRLT
jgi:chemotaxis protein methyltransferase CheR